MSEYEQPDEDGAAEPGPRDAGVAHDGRSAHSLEVAGYQEPPGHDADEGVGAPRRTPGEPAGAAT